jgi:NADH-quinone oxidoreductase subunit I
MTDVYEFSEFDRKNLIYNYSSMTQAEVVTAKDKLRKYDEEQAAKKAAAAAAPKPTAPPVAPPKPESPPPA